MTRHAKAGIVGFDERPRSRSRRSGALGLGAALLFALVFLAFAPAALANGKITIEVAPGSAGEGTISGGEEGTALTDLNCHVSGGTATGTCTTQITVGFEELEFHAGAEGGSSFVEWSATGELASSTCNVSQKTQASCFGSMGSSSQDSTLTVKFEAPPNVTVEAAPGSTGSGTVTVTHYGSSTDPLNCHIEGAAVSGDCKTSVGGPGEELEFQATPDSGSLFAEWETAGAMNGSSCHSNPTSNPCEVGLGAAQIGTLKAKFIPATPSLAVQPAGAIGPLTATLNGTVNPNGNAVTDCHFEYVTREAFLATGFTDLSSGGTASCTPAPGSGSSAEAVSAEISGLSAGKDYEFRLVATNVNGTAESSGLNFTSAPAVKDLATEEATGVAPFSATLNGTLDPNGMPITDCYFEYVSNEAFLATGFNDLSSGGTVPCVPDPGSDAGPVAVSAEISGLSADTNYNFRLVAINANGTTAGSAKLFLTSAMVFTEAATAVHRTSALLNGSFDLSGDPGVTSCEFEWGTDTSYSGGTLPCEQGSSFSASAEVSATLGFLDPGSTYHYRLVVTTTAHGESKGHDRTVTTQLPEVTRNLLATFGSNGTSATTFGPLDQLAFDQVHHKLYALEAGGAATIFGFDASAPPTFTPLPGFSPLNTGVAGGGHPGVAVDSTALPSSGNVYYSSEAENVGRKVWGYDPSGVPLGGNFPLDPKVDYGFAATVCGVTVDSDGTISAASGHTGDGTANKIFRYSPSGVYQGTIALQLGSAPCEPVFAANADLYVGSIEGGGGVTKYTAASGYTEHTSITDQSTAIAADQDTGHLFVTKREGGGGAPVKSLVDEFDSSGKLFSEFATGISGAEYAGVTVDESTEDVYVADRGNGKIRVYGPAIASPPKPTITPGNPTAVEPNTATLNAKVDPETIEVTDCHFDYGTTTAYGQTAPCSPAPGSGSGDVAVSAGLTGLTPGATYHFRIVASNTGATATGADQTLTTPPAVKGVTTEAATGITGTSATLHGSLDPNDTPVSDCRLEFATDGEFQADGFASARSSACTPDPGSGSGTVAVTADATELEAGTTYHFRLVASNAFGTTSASPLTFETPGATIAEESVDSISDSGATLHAAVNPRGAETSYQFEYTTEVAFEAEGFEGAATAPTTPTSIGAGPSAVAVSQQLTELQPATTYRFRAVATSPEGTDHGFGGSFTTYASPHGFPSCTNDTYRSGASAGLPDCRAYEQASPVDKHGAAVQHHLNLVQAAADGSRVSFGDAAGLPTSGGSSHPSPFIASRGADGWSTVGTLPLLAKPGVLGTVLGWSPNLSTSLSASPEGLYLGDTASETWQLAYTGSGDTTGIAGITEDGSRIAYESLKALVPGAVGGKPNLYELEDGTVSLAGRVPSFPATSCNDSTHAPDCVVPAEGSFAGPYDGSDLKHGGPSRDYYPEGAASSDGTKVFFTEAGTGRLYLREDNVRTVQVSASQASTPDPNGHKPALWQAATPSGSVVFFTSCEKLTDDSTAASTGANSCTESGQGSDLYSYDTEDHQLTDLTVDTSGDPRGADVQGVLGAGADGSDVYFAATGALAAGASPGSCCNLYLSHEGTVSFIARLGANAGGDSDDWNSQFNFSAQHPKTSRVSANGTLLFSASENLGPYDSHGIRELYRYAPGDSEPQCVSCDPTGAAPLADASLEQLGISFSTLQPFLTRNISADGKRVFFNSPDALVGSDVNGRAGCPSAGEIHACSDVYEWEAKGSGSCQSEVEDGGCLYLISSGTSTDGAAFGDASESGDDVFFFTSQQLVPQDGDLATDVYDARVEGGLTSQHPQPDASCEGEACRGQGSSAPNSQGAGTAAFQGPGNPPTEKVKKHHKKKRHHRHARHHKRGAHAKRGGGK